MANPVWSAKLGSFSSAIFLNEREVNGTKVMIPSVKFTKSYVKKDGDPKNKDDWVNDSQNHNNAGEIDKAITLLQRTKEALYDKDFSE